MCVLSTILEIYKKQLMVGISLLRFIFSCSLFLASVFEVEKKKSMKFIEMESESRKENGK